MVSWDEVGALVALVFFWVLARRAKQRIKEENKTAGAADSTQLLESHKLSAQKSLTKTQSSHLQPAVDLSRFQKKGEGLVYIECGYYVRFVVDNCVGWTLRELVEWLQVYFSYRQYHRDGPHVFWLPEEMVKVEINQLPVDYDYVIKDKDRIVFDPTQKLAGMKEQKLLQS